jgi:type IV pilus assembly protein PilM
MAKTVLSVVIGTEITKVCEVTYKRNYKNKGIRVYKSITFPTPENMIEDGYIKDKGAFAVHLRSQLKQAQMKARRVIFSVSSSKIANREVIIPLVKESRIFDIIKTGASEYFPVDIKDYILSYIILEKKTSDRKEREQAKQQAELEARQAREQAKREKKLAKKSKQKNSGELNTIPVTRLKFSEEEGQISQASVTAQDHMEKKEKSQNKKHIRLSVYAVPSNLVKNYYNFADIMGLELISIDYSGNSSYQMLKRQANEGTNVFIQLNEQDTVISILRDNVMVLQRTVGYGISSLIETVLEQRCFGVYNAKEAMELLSNRNLLAWKESKAPQINPPPFLTEAAPALLEAAATLEENMPGEAASLLDEEYQAKRNVVEALIFLVNSVSRMLDYYKNNNKNVTYRTIYLSGFGSRVQGIEEIFSERIGIYNKKLEKLNSVSASKKAKDYRLNPSEFMPCVGAVIKPVNFVPTELVERRQRIQAIIAAAFLILLSIGGSGVLCYCSYTDYLSAKSSYEAAAEQLAQMPVASGIKEEHENASAQLSDLQKLEASTHDNERIAEVLSELKKNMLTNSSIQSIQFEDTGIIMNIILSDNKYDANVLVAKLLTQLKTIELFTDVQDSNLVISEDGQISLTVSCTYQ